MSSNGDHDLRSIGLQIQDTFRQKKRLISFGEYYQLFLEQPTRQARNTAQYLRDMFDHYGVRTEKKPFGKVQHFQLFDGVQADQPDRSVRLRAGERLVGHEEVQERIYRILTAFVRERRVNKLMLLHGPNGSAKSTLISCIMRAMKAYSRSDQGALYRFRWVFPRKAATQKGIGFGGQPSPLPGNLDTYAYLPEDEVEARLNCEISDHPLFLVPVPERKRLLAWALGNHPQGREFILSDYILHGDLCPKCREVFESLLRAYHGDYQQVLRHVQVERFFIDPRYRSAAVTVEPQLRVDAGMRQVSMDASLGALPASLQFLTLFSPYGDLVDANRGVVEYNDLLKRPVEAWKYILSTCEKSTVALDNAILYLDEVFFGSTNDLHLDAFKESPDFATFKGRIELIRTPYLLDYRQEEEIYADSLAGGELGRHVAPHTARVAALWAVLTRLRQPREDEFPDELQPLVRRLSPLDKAELYSTGAVPETFSEEEAKLLRNSVDRIYQDGENADPFEGRIGASPRELKMVLLNAAQDPDYHCISPLPVLKELHELIRDPSLYRFLQMQPEGEYFQPAAFIDAVRSYYLDLVLVEVQRASGLVAARQHEDLFDRYITHVTHWIRKERVLNRITGKYEEPSAQIMEDVEEMLQITGNPELFRQNLIGRIGAWRIDHPDQAIDYKLMFPAYIRRIQESYFEQNRRALEQVLTDFVAFYGEGLSLPDEQRHRVEEMMRVMATEQGYCSHCAVDVVGVLLRERVE